MRALGDPGEVAALLQPGDVVLVADGAGEPTALLEAVVESRAQLDHVRLVLGLTLTRTVLPEHLDRLGVSVLGGYGTNRPLVSAGAEVLALPLSAMEPLIRGGAFEVDVVLVQVTPPNAQGIVSLGPTVGFLPAALERARVGIAQVNEAVPWTGGDALISAERLDHVTRVDRLLPAVTHREPDDVVTAIAAAAAELVADGATVQFGLGEVTEAVAHALKSHRRLGLHTGIVGDALVELIESGALTGEDKPVDRGLAITLLVGSQRLYRYVDGHPSVVLRSTSHTHSPGMLARFEDLVAVNGATEVDLTGQVNAERAGGSYLGAVGGHLDFSHAAATSQRGRSIVVLRSTAAGGGSRIVAALDGGIVTTPRSYVDTVVTEHGVADLRGCSLERRAERIVAVAAPPHRDSLWSSWVSGRSSGRRGATRVEKRRAP